MGAPSDGKTRDADVFDVDEVAFDVYPGGFDDEERRAIANEARSGRELDRQVAGALEHRQPTTSGLSTGYIDRLGQRAQLPRSAEQRLVRAAIAGDATARSELVRLSCADRQCGAQLSRHRAHDAHRADAGGGRGLVARTRAL